MKLEEFETIVHKIIETAKKSTQISFVDFETIVKEILNVYKNN